MCLKYISIKQNYYFPNVSSSHIHYLKLIKTTFDILLLHYPERTVFSFFELVFLIKVEVIKLLHLPLQCLLFEFLPLHFLFLHLSLHLLLCSLAHPIIEYNNNNTSYITIHNGTVDNTVSQYSTV